MTNDVPLMKFPRERGYWQIIVFVGARYKHVRKSGQVLIYYVMTVHSHNMRAQIVRETGKQHKTIISSTTAASLKPIWDGTTCRNKVGDPLNLLLQ